MLAVELKVQRLSTQIRLSDSLQLQSRSQRALDALKDEQPSAALTAQAAANGAFDTPFLGLSTVGVANITVIAVLQRRSEIGLRRALGATGPDPHPVPA
jgi:putative ABC transport system permease protein